MAVNPEHAPHTPHVRLPDFRGAARWVQTNWMPIGLSLAATALGLTGYFMATHDGGTQNPTRPTTEASDTFKPANPGSEAVAPIILTPTETAVSPSPTAAATPKPLESTPTVTVKALTSEIKSLSSQTVDIKTVSLEEEQLLYQKAVAEGKNKIPIPVPLGETGKIEEYVLPNGIHGLAIKNLEIGKTYTIVAPTAGRAEGQSKEDNLKYSPNSKTTGVNFYPSISNPNGKYDGITSYGFPLNAKINPKFRASNNSPWENFKERETLATFTVNDPGLPEQKEFEALFGKGAAMVIAVGKDGVNKQPISLPDVFLQDDQGHPVVLQQ